MSSMTKSPSVRPANRNHEAVDASGTDDEDGSGDEATENDPKEDDEGSKDEVDGGEPCGPVESDEVVDRESGEEDAEGNDAEEEHTSPRGLRDPGTPSPAERADHELTHIPYRSWCKHCVRGKAKGRQSRRLSGDDKESDCPRVRFDYCIISDRTREESLSSAEEGADETGAMADDEHEDAEIDGSSEGRSITVLVMQESQSRSVWAYCVQSKGASEEWVIEQIAEDLDTVGLKNDRIVLKTDQEPAAQEVSRAVARTRATDYGTTIESSAVGESNTNASIERAIQDVQAQIRTMRSAL